MDKLRHVLLAGPMQLPHVQLVITPNIQLDGFLRVSEKALGHSLTRPLTGRETDSERFLCALSCFHSPENLGKPIREILTSAGSSLQSHLHFGMLFIALRTAIFKSMERTRLYHTIATDLPDLQLALVSGPYDVWRQACIDATADPQTRSLYNKVVLEFERNKLWFDSCDKKKTPDGFLLLEKK